MSVDQVDQWRLALAALTQREEEGEWTATEVLVQARKSRMVRGRYPGGCRCRARSRGGVNAVWLLIVALAVGGRVAGGFDWSGCDEREFPKDIPIGNCTAGNTAICADALDGNSSTFYRVGVLQVEQRLFGEVRSIDVGDDFPGSLSIGVNLDGAKAILTRVVITPHPDISEWDPPPHVYNTPKDYINWSTAVVGGTFQGSSDGQTWSTLYTIESPVAVHPANSTFVLANFTVSSCLAYSHFRYNNQGNTTRRYFVNTEFGPIEKIETISLASLSDISFYGVPASSFPDLSCLASHPDMSMVAAPNPGLFLSSANIAMWTPLFKCSASVYYTTDGSSPTTGSASYAEGAVVSLSGGSTDGVIDTSTINVMYSITGAESSPQSFTYTFGPTVGGTTGICGQGDATYPGSQYCYAYTGSPRRTFLEAEAACIEWGGHLASVHSAEEDAFVASLIQETTGQQSVAWIGYSNVLNGNQPDEALRVAELEGTSGGVYAWSDGSVGGFSNWIYGGPLHSSSRSCAMVGRGDWWVSECGVETGRLCAGRTWGSWGGGWLDVVGLPFSDEEEICYQDQEIGTTARCTQPAWVGTDLDDPCRQKMGHICKKAATLVCPPGYYGPSGGAPCSPCPSGTYSKSSNSSECTPCSPGSSPADDRVSCVVGLTVHASAAAPVDCAKTCRTVLRVESSASGTFDGSDTTYSPADISDVSCGAGLNVSSGDAFFEIISATSRRVVQPLAVVCCGAVSQGLEPCPSLTTAMQAVSAYGPSSDYSAEIAVQAGYYTSDVDLVISRNVSISCPQCAQPDPILHISDLFILTRCLTSAGNSPTETINEGLATGRDNCDAATFDNELLECPQGYHLVEADFNPSDSKAQLCVEYSDGPRRVSDVFFRNVTFVNTTGWNCSEPDVPYYCDSADNFSEYTDVCPEGTEQFAQNVVDGTTIFHQVYMCVVRNGTRLLTDINFTFWNQSDTGTPQPMFVGECDLIDFTDHWRCLQGYNEPQQAVFDPQGLGRVLRIECDDCAVSLRNLTFQGGNVSQFQVPGPDTVSVGSDQVSSACGHEPSLGGAILAHGLTDVVIDRCIVQNSSARCGGGIAVSGSASLSISNSTFFDNLAFGTLNGTSMGGGLFSIDTRQELAVEPLWAVGSWANPPLLNKMHEETAGPIQDVKRVARQRGETDSRVGISDTKFWNNAALSTGGAQRTFGGGIAVANGAYQVSGAQFWYNVATDGGSVAAVGESNETRCNGNDPPVALVQSTDCSITVGEVKTSLLMRLSNMTHHALRPFVADQRLFTNTRIDCDPIQTSLCYASYLNGSGWVNIFVGASDRARAASEVSAPHWPKIGDDVPGADGVVPPAAHIYLSNSISDMEYGVGDEDDVERSVTVRVSHSPCVSASEGAGEMCQVTKSIRMPCCRADVGALEET